MQILVAGSGYVGLVTGACLADMGHNVTCMDNDEHKIQLLKNNKMPIYEPGLEELVCCNVAEGRLQFTTTLRGEVDKAEVIFICVPTPVKESGEADLIYVESICKEIAREMRSYKLIVEKSTVPIHTAQWLKKLIKEQFPQDVEFDVACNPEFLREGSAIYDFMNPDRIVIGTSSERASNIMVQLYQPLNAPLLIVDIESAELIKHASNAFLAMKISFANAISRICENSKADIVKVLKGVGLDSRIGLAHLNAGVGYGGACLPKDVQAFIKISEKLGYDFQLLKAVDEINRSQRLHLVKKLQAVLGNTIKGKQIGILGLSFKPNTDDIRGAPSLDIIPILLREGVIVKAYDPKAVEKMRLKFPDINYVNSPYQVAQGSDALVILTEWEEFRRLNLPKVKSLLRKPVVIDGRNIFEPSKMEALGFIYRGMGRG